MMEPDEEGLSPHALMVKRALLERGLESPVISCPLSPQEKIDKVAGHIEEIMKILGLDLDDDSLHETPRRIGRMYVNEIFSGLDYRNFPQITLIENKMKFDEMIKVKDISLTSTCEHHFVVIDGTATVAYMPNTKIIGLSKINRIVQFFSRRPQVQERLTQQILAALQVLLDTKNVAVSITAAHYCVKARGARDQTSLTTTTALGGYFKHNAASRQEFFTD